MRSHLAAVFSAGRQWPLLCIIAAAFLSTTAAGAVIDDFSGDLSAYTLSRVNDNNTAANVSFSIVDGALRASYAGSSTYEQVLLLRDDCSLDVGDILVADLTHTGAGWDRDLGIAVGYSKMPPSLAGGTSGDVRTNYVEISYRSNNQVMTYGRDGTANLSSGQAWASAVEALYIERTGLRDFALGYIKYGSAVMVKTYSITTDPVIGAAVGFYADIRAAVSLSPAGVDNLRIIRPAQLYITPEGQPANAAVPDGDAALFTAQFVSDDTPTVTWYHFADEVWNPLTAQAGKYEIDVTSQSGSNVYQTTLNIVNASMQDEGLYLCGIDAAEAGAVLTDPALLAIKCMVAHWTLNTGDYASGVHMDQTAGYELVSPAADFVTGAAGIAETALSIGIGASTESLSALFENGLTVSAWCRPDAAGQLAFSDSVHTLDANTLQADQWTHVCLVFDGQNARAYLDSRASGQHTWPLSATYEMVLELGHTSHDSVFAGTVDDVRLYNYSLAPDEVYELYARRTGDAGCVLDYACMLDVSGPDGWPDCRIDLYDFAAAARQWLQSEDPATEFADVLALADEWLGCGLEPGCL